MVPTRVMRMQVHEWRVFANVSMRFSAVVVFVVAVLMVFVVSVSMGVDQTFAYGLCEMLRLFRHR